MIEVEVKANVDDFIKVKKNLDKIGAIKIKNEHQSDVYYNAPHKDFVQTDEELRIRQIPEDKETKVILTYKCAKMDNVSKTREEIEVEIFDAKNMDLILENLNFRKTALVKKDRDIYHLNEFIITLDTVHNVGKFVEIEIEAHENDDTTIYLNKIFEIYKKLGIEEGFERRSYLELMEL